MPHSRRVLPLRPLSTHLTCLTRAAAAALLVTLMPLAAQGFSTSVRFVNFANTPRTQWGVATVPFPAGVWTAGKSFTVPGLPAELLPFGARWPDGSVRYAQLVVPLDLAAGAETVVNVVQGQSASPPFALSSWVRTGLPVFNMQLVVTGKEIGTQTAPMSLLRVVENSRFRQVLHFRARLPRTDLVYDLWLSVYSGQDHVPFELRVTSSSTESAQWLTTIEGLDLIVHGAIPSVHGAIRRGVRMSSPSTTGPNAVRLLGRTTFFDGQAQEWFGDLLFYHPTGAASEAKRAATLAAVVQADLVGVSTDWKASGAFGPFGHVPDFPPWIKDGGRAAVTAQRVAFESWVAQPGRQWEDYPLGLFPAPWSTGWQPDFGTAKLLAVFASGLPDGIAEGRFNMSEEANRPVHHRERDGRPVRVVDHPRWVTWDGRTHFSRQTSPDRLGKPFPPATVQANGWQGRDGQHWSSLTLSATYLLTGSHSLRHEMENEAQLYIAQHTVPSQRPNTSTNGMAASRSIGRTLMSMAWNYLCTGNDELAQHIGRRVHEVIRANAVGLKVKGPVRPVTLYAPNPRNLNETYWSPWEDAQAILGLEAVYRVLGDFDAHLVAVMATKSLMTWGWLITPSQLIVGTAVAWQEGGRSLTAQQYANPAYILWAFGTGFNEWSIPAVKLAMRYGQMYGDADLLARGTYVYQQLQSWRRPPTSANGLDRFFEWDAVK